MGSIIIYAGGVDGEYWWAKIVASWESLVGKPALIYPQHQATVPAF
jgi:hypothetical protein